MPRRAALTFGLALLAASGGIVATSTQASSSAWPIVSGGYTLQTIAYEGFSYGSGTIANRNGGTGWSNAWAGDPHASWQDFVTNQSGLTYTGLPTDDSAIRATATGGNNSDTWRVLDDSVDSGVVYFQFLSVFQSNHGGGTPNIRLFYGASQTGGIGNNGFAPSNMALMDASLSPIAVSSAPLTQLNLTVLRIDYTQNKTSMWLNPNMATFDYANPPADDTYVQGFAPQIDKVYLISRYGGDTSKDKFDEIRIMRLVPPTPAPPPPAVPASAPLEVKASPSDSEATVSWSAPASSGSFAVSTYQAIASPSGKMCLATGYSCSISGLSNGNSYTFQVRALTGAGWGAWSEPSAAVVPQAPPLPAILITGSRSKVDGRPGVSLSGTSRHLDPGSLLTPWARVGANGSYVMGRTQVPVAADGTFEWQRRANAQVAIFVTTADERVRSNVVVIR